MSGAAERRARRQTETISRQELIALLRSVLDPRGPLAMGHQGLTVNLDESTLRLVTGSPWRISAIPQAAVSAAGTPSFTTTATGYPYALGVLNW